MNIADYITHSEQTELQPLVENGIHYKGIFVKSLHYDKETNRSKTILLKFESNTSYPYHFHPVGEEIFVLEGNCKIAGELLQKGDYLYTPPTGKHSVTSPAGCVLFLSIPEEVILIEE